MTKCVPECGCDRHAPHRRRPLQERFWQKVDKRGPDECWPWLAARNTPGYAMLRVGGKTYNAAHRLAYEWLVGPIPAGMVIDHLCRNRACVNPAHMEPVTNRENILRGTNPPALQARQTHCKRGHEFTPENTISLSAGRRRRCRACTEEWSRTLRVKCGWCDATITPGGITPPSHGICDACLTAVLEEAA